MYIVTAQHEYKNKNNMAYMYIVTAQHEYKNKKQHGIHVHRHSSTRI